MSGVSDREQQLRAVLGSSRLEGAEPSREAQALLEQWAAGELDDTDLARLATRAAAGEPLPTPAPSRAA